MSNTTSLLRILIFDDTERANILVQALEASEYTVAAHTSSVGDLLPQAETMKTDVILKGKCKLLDRFVA